MFDLIAEATKLFSEKISFYEVAAEANASISCTISDLPCVEKLTAFLDSFCKCDTVELSIKSYLDFSYSSTNPHTLEADYVKFIESSEPEDAITINIHINKAFDDKKSLTIYSFDSFISYYNRLSFYELIQELATALKKHAPLIFHVIDREINLATNSVCFYHNPSMLKNNTINRDVYLANLNNASLFLNRNELPLSPYDFRIIHNTGTNNLQLTDLLKKLETIFAYVYLSYSSHIVSDQIVLQLSPSSANMVLKYIDAVPCQYICNLYQWSLEEDHAIERVGIVRNLLELNCKTTSNLVLKDDSLLLSAKSNYILFQKKTVDKYIELKNCISLTIVEATTNMQEILQTLVDAVRNNFVAVIMFLITVIITDSISWDDLVNGSVLNTDLLLVIRFFCVSSFLYLLITLMSVIIKWRYFYSGYKKIKNNYKDILDKDDLLRAFDNDNAIKDVKKVITCASLFASLIWLIFLYFLYTLVW